jgi:hypothetical protein
MYVDMGLRVVVIIKLDPVKGVNYGLIVVR